jgi:heterotetrameric sarcosine oxidase gamma subunit
MVDVLSPLAPVWKPGTHGNVAGGIGIVLTETQPGSIVQLAAWPGEEKNLIAAIRALTTLSLPDGAGAGAANDFRAAFGFAPGRFLVVDQAEGLAEEFLKTVTSDTGTVTDLSRGRAALRISGPRSEWVLSKFFAIDFAEPAFPIGSGISTVHHDVFAQIQRTGSNHFDLYVFRSFARSFWKALCHASEEVGYEVS